MIGNRDLEKPGVAVYLSSGANQGWVGPPEKAEAQIGPAHAAVGNFMGRLEGCFGKGVDGLVVFPVEVEGGFANAVMGAGGGVAEA